MLLENLWELDLGYAKYSVKELLKGEMLDDVSIHIAFFGYEDRHCILVYSLFIIDLSISYYLHEVRVRDEDLSIIQ
jgi:hypothetical protein